MSILELHENGTMNYLVRVGFITPSALRKIDLFVQVKELEDKGFCRSHAVQEVSIRAKVCESTVWKSLRIIAL